MMGLGRTPSLGLGCATGRFQREAVAADRSVIGWVGRTLAVDGAAKILYPSCHNKGC
jgi:hypothetical protein